MDCTNGFHFLLINYNRTLAETVEYATRKKTGNETLLLLDLYFLPNKKIIDGLKQKKSKNGPDMMALRPVRAMKAPAVDACDKGT